MLYSIIRMGYWPEGPVSCQYLLLPVPEMPQEDEGTEAGGWSVGGRVSVVDSQKQRAELGQETKHILHGDADAPITELGRARELHPQLPRPDCER